MSAPVALVTGATSGIGRAIALRLAADGFHVAAAGRDHERGKATLDALRGGGGRGQFLAFDATDEAGWRAALDGLVAEHGRLDALVNSAGIFFQQPLPDMGLDDWRRVWRANVHSVFLGTREGMRAMQRTHRAGSIVNLSSLAGRIGIAGCTAYGASKAAVDFVSRTAAVAGGRLAPPVRVNSLAPGVILTEMITGAYGAGEETRAFVKAGNALDLVGEAHHIAAAASFLAGPRSAMVTGIVHTMDGGRGLD